MIAVLVKLRVVALLGRVGLPKKVDTQPQFRAAPHRVCHTARYNSDESYLSFYDGKPVRVQPPAMYERGQLGRAQPRNKVDTH
nr:MAG TPA: hypothetical protein [Caudoviricetes sp.]